CFFFNLPAPTELSPLSLHDALPISPGPARILPLERVHAFDAEEAAARAYALELGDDLRLDVRPVADHVEAVRSSDVCVTCTPSRDRKSTRLNSSHDQISYAVFCLKK